MVRSTAEPGAVSGSWLKAVSCLSVACAIPQTWDVNTVPTYYLKEIKCLRSQSHYITTVVARTHTGLHTGKPSPVCPAIFLRKRSWSAGAANFFFFTEKSASSIDNLWAKCTSGFILRKQRPTIRWGKRFQKIFWRGFVWQILFLEPEREINAMQRESAKIL